MSRRLLSGQAGDRTCRRAGGAAGCQAEGSQLPAEDQGRAGDSHHYPAPFSRAALVPTYIPPALTEPGKQKGDHIFHNTKTRKRSSHLSPVRRPASLMVERPAADTVEAAAVEDLLDPQVPVPKATREKPKTSPMAKERCSKSRCLR